MKNYLNSTLSLDLRSIGLARILIGFFACFYFFEFFKEVDVFYSNKAVLSYPAVFKLTNSPVEIYPFKHIRDLSFVPLLKFSQTSLYVYVLVLIGMLSSFLVMLGHKTKTFCFVAWIVAAAMYDRFPSIAHGGDFILKLSLLWMIFLPSDKRFAFFSRDRTEGTDEFVAPVCAFWIFQILVLYFLNTYYKSVEPKWYGSWSAFYYLGHADYVLTGLGKWVLAIPFEFGQFLTKFVLVIEAFFPFFLFLPYQKMIRPWIILFFILFHIMIWMTIDISYVSQFCIAWWITLLPFEVWKNKYLSTFNNWFSKDSVKIELIRDSRYLSAVMIFCTSLIFASTVNIVSGDKSYTQFSLVGSLVRWMQLEQWWSMFVKNPRLDYDGWFITNGVLMNGNRVDILTGMDVSLERPKNYMSVYKSYHFRKFLRDYSLSDSEFLNENLGRFFCKKWNEEHSDVSLLKSFELIFMNEQTPPPGSPISKAVPQVRFNYTCNS